MNIHRKIILAIVFLQIPYLILVFGGFFYFNPQIKESLHLMEVQRDTMFPLHELQQRILINSQPLTSALLFGTEVDQDVYIRSNVLIERMFQESLNDSQIDPKSRSYLQRSHQEWRQSSRLGESLLGDGATVEPNDIDQLQISMYNAVKLLNRAQKSSYLNLLEDSQTTQQFTATADVLFSVVLGFTLVLSLLATYYMVHFISQPLLVVENAAKEFEQGNFSHRIERGASRDQIGRLNKAFNAMADEIESLVRKLERYSLRDELTNLYNRREFNLQFQKEMARSHRHQLSFAIVVFDLDRFKNINDTYGHLFGDRVLKGFSDVLEQTKRTSDIAARFGGEEFVVIFTNTDRDGALRIADRIRRRLERVTFFTDDEQAVKVTVSGGVATYPLCGKNERDLFEAADRALYHAKSEGRNRIVACAGPEGKDFFSFTSPTADSGVIPILQDQ